MTLLNDLLQEAINREASDLHLIADYYPTIRINGVLFPLTQFPILTPQITNNILLPILNDQQKETLFNNKEIDLSYSYKEYRFRVNLYYAQKSLSGSFRLIPLKIKTLEELNLPSELKNFTKFRQGLIIVCGPTSQGKSTTLASMINEINLNYKKHIITIENPIEFIFPKGQSIISQREMYEDTYSWTRALKSALREDPDVILISEMRDFDTIQLALTAAETGHLVLSTLHTNSSSEAIDRIVDIFPSHQQNQIRNQLASVFKVIITQRLIPKINNIERIPALEILINTPAVASVIRENKTFLINNILQTQETEGQVFFEKYLINLYKKGLISDSTAHNYAIRPKELAKLGL